jgi:hypothetical protein
VSGNVPDVTLKQNITGAGAAGSGVVRERKADGDGEAAAVISTTDVVDAQQTIPAAGRSRSRDKAGPATGDAGSTASNSQPAPTGAGTAGAATAAGPPPVLYVELPTTSFGDLLGAGDREAAAASSLFAQVAAQATAPAVHRPISNPDDLAAEWPRLDDIVLNMGRRDINEVLGNNAEQMGDRFDLQNAGYSKDRLNQVYRFADTVLTDLTHKVLGQVENGEYKLNPARLSIERTEDAHAQHEGYVAGVLSRLPDLPERLNLELARKLLNRYFDGTLRDTSGAQQDARVLLADNLSKAAGGADSVRQFVLSSDHDSMFSREALNTPQALLPNLAAHYAGEAVLQFASKMFNGNDERATAFVESVFRRPDADVQQMLRDPQGPEGLLVQFAAMAQHQGWAASKLADASVTAHQGDPGAALREWNHPDLLPMHQLIAEDPEGGRKAADQIESFLLRSGTLVPCERDGEMGAIPLSRLLERIEKDGIFNDSGSLRVISPYAASVKQALHHEVKQAAEISDWHVGADVTADVVANMSAAFASHASKADFEQRKKLASLYRNSIALFAPQVDQLLADGAPTPKDEHYQALYQEMAGEFGFEALKQHMGVGRAHDLARNANLANIIPMVCEDLRIPAPAGYNAQTVVADLEKLQKTLLKDDYFLSKPGFLDSMRDEAQQKPGKVKPQDLQNAIRVPNAIWMWTQLLRGLVEKKPGRYTSEEIDLKSDKFPSGVQLNPPDIRDVELFTWARHRLEAHGETPSDAKRMALSLIVLTQYKDLLQLRNAA